MAILRYLRNVKSFGRGSPNDTWLLALADKSKAHYLVTGDKKAGILSLIAVGQTKIVTTSVFCDKVL